MPKLTDLNIPGVGHRSLTNFSGLLSIFLGLVVLVLMWGYAQLTANKVKAQISNVLPMQGRQVAPVPRSNAPEGKVVLG